MLAVYVRENHVEGEVCLRPLVVPVEMTKEDDARENVGDRARRRKKNAVWYVTYAS